MASDLCDRWRKTMQYGQEENLSADELESLHAHLAVCKDCQNISMADSVLKNYLHAGVPSLTADFDEKALSSLAITGKEKARAELRSVRVVFAAQALAGVIAAITLVWMSLAPLTQSSSLPTPLTVQSSIYASHAPLSASLEMLLQTPTPRASLLWHSTSSAPFIVR